MDEKYNRLLWHSRRSSLELDLLLGSYIKNRYKTLPPDLKEDYRKLLDLDDIHLRQWLISKKPPFTRFCRITQDILTYAKNNKP